jgi:hypothetical protein
VRSSDILLDDRPVWALAHQLQLICDGAAVAADLEGDRDAFRARGLAQVALEAAQRR